jgi:hypothetical protein
MTPDERFLHLAEVRSRLAERRPADTDFLLGEVDQLRAVLLAIAQHPFTPWPVEGSMRCLARATLGEVAMSVAISTETAGDA